MERRSFILSLPLVIGFGAATVRAQGAGEGAPSPTAGTMNDAEQEQFRAYVRTQNLPHVEATRTMAVGDTMPESGVTYYPIPPQFRQSHYRYAYMGNRIIIVDPSNRRVMQIISM